MKVAFKNITQTVAPAVEPVSLAEMKAHLRIDGGDADTLISAQIQAAREYVEKIIQRAIVQRTYRADLWRFYGVIELPMPKLSSITSVKYFTDDSPQVLTTLTGFYIADLGRGWLYLDPGQGSGLPSVAARHDAVQVTYVAGYEPDSNSPQDLTALIPEAIKAAVKLQVGDLFENRETNTQLRMQELPTVTNLLRAYRQH